MNPDKKYSKMDYEVEIKRLEKRLNDLEQTLTTGFIFSLSIIAYFVVSSLGGRSY